MSEKKKKIVVVIDDEEDSKYQEIELTEDPTQDKWCLPALYMYSVKGGLMLWQVKFDGVNQLEMHHGYVDGVIRVDKTEIFTNTSGRNIVEQALLDARDRYRSKRRQGYSTNCEGDNIVLKRMKGVKYNEKSIKKWPVLVEAKLDGIAMTARIVEGRLTLKSNSNKEMVHITHCRPEIEKFLDYLPSGSMLDGELYYHGWDYNTIQSVVMSTVNIHRKLKKIIYHIFDVHYKKFNGESPTKEERIECLKNAYKQYLEDGNTSKKFCIIPTDIIPQDYAYSHEEVIEYNLKYVALGFEGVMVKKLAGENPTKLDKERSYYKEGRSSNIMKYKTFEDDEGIVVEVTESTGTEKGLAILHLLLKDGNKIRLRMDGSFDIRRRWFENPEEILGKEVTFKYQGLSSKGIPRFPTGTKYKSIRHKDT